MKFEEALKAMKSGIPVKLPSWAGYWWWDEESQTILMYTKDGGCLDIRETQNVEYTLRNIFSDEWIYANGQNCPILGGEATFSFGEAIKYLKRGMKVARKGWNGKKQYIQLATGISYRSTEGETVNTILLPVNRRKAPENFESPEDVDLFHHTVEATAEYQRRAKESEKNASTQAADAEAWAHGREDHPDQAQDNAKYYAKQAAKSAAEVPGKTEQAKKDIDKYIRQKESELKGDTGNVFFAAFKVVNGRLKMYSDPTVDKLCFRREGSRLKYRLKF